MKWEGSSWNAWLHSAYYVYDSYQVPGLFARSQGPDLVELHRVIDHFIFGNEKHFI